VPDIEKALQEGSAYFDMRTSIGWRYLVEYIEKLVDSEKESLMSEPLEKVGLIRERIRTLRELVDYVNEAVGFYLENVKKKKQ